MKLYIFCLSFVLLIAGCGIQVIPRSLPNAIVDSTDNSVSSNSNDLKVTTRIQDLDFGPYTGRNNITSFYVVITNLGEIERSVPLSSFVLLNQDKQIFRPLDPDHVKMLMRQESNYLIPYPYVGFYYLKDNAEFEYTGQTSSSVPYTSLKSHADPQSSALPVGIILPGTKIAGMLYFNIDLYEMQSVDLMFHLTEDGPYPETDLSFPFDIVK